MKLIDLVTQLRSRLPLLTEAFTDTLEVVSIIHAGTTATIITSEDHGLDVDDSVHVIGAKTPVAISSITHVLLSGIGIATTAVDHDLTLFGSGNSSANVVDVSGATEADFNGTGLVLLDVPNRRTFHYAIPVGAIAAATGSPVLENGSNVFNTVRGEYGVVSVPTPTTLTVTHADASDLGTLIGSITLRVKPRITGGIDTTSIIASFSAAEQSKVTGKRPVKAWAYALIGDVVPSRGRDSRLDAVDVQSRGYDWQQYILTPVQIFVAQGSAGSTLGRNTRDDAEDFFRPILRSLLGKKFPTGLADGDCGEVQFVGHGLTRYDGATYWHEFNFEQRAIISFGDTIGEEDSVAFRDFDITITPDIDEPNQGTGSIRSTPSLDDTPL